MTLRNDTVDCWVTVFSCGKTTHTSMQPRMGARDVLKQCSISPESNLVNQWDFCGIHKIEGSLRRNGGGGDPKASRSQKKVTPAKVRTRQSPNPELSAQLADSQERITSLGSAGQSSPSFHLLTLFVKLGGAVRIPKFLLSQTRDLFSLS